eukprot:CAMPEP_0183703852 /NCGR_PEP_ID=MMETSP0737-20130205/1425_1 /TAXON_ID=385413 /ORGANISM="Thalassiosira miniscula, Strain CCMP1093" /LENGTH=330 /DNA_ID=CAMNT_0025930651 /DNA_START=173 /DNA_END=1163 /DNA_ORIENTATION=+
MGSILSAMLIASATVQGYTDYGIFRQNFEETDWDFNSLIRVQDYSSGGEGYGRILKVFYPPDDRGSPRVTKEFDLESVKSATLSFDMKLHSQFEFVKGGKLHGIGGGTTTTGCDPIDPNGWTVRLMWKQEGVPQVYVYHQDREARCGDGFRPSNDFKFERGQWYRIDLQVQMNSTPESADGRTLLYINGEKLVDVDGLRLSGNADVDIDKFKFSTFYGGSDETWSPSKTTYIYYDNFTVQRGLRVTGEQGTNAKFFLAGSITLLEKFAVPMLVGRVVAVVVVVFLVVAANVALEQLVQVVKCVIRHPVRLAISGFLCNLPKLLYLGSSKW